ncbi:MAG: ribosome-associated translation inhibitor RaiA [Gammaproteobacteria bacterium]|nr:ribosome-associated translation inhibitor RaiA [Gammaproteobacteria bacterium]
MQITVSGHHVEVTSSLREYVESKLQRLERHFDHLTTVHVVLSVEKLLQKAEATLHLAGANLFADAIEEDMYAAIDALADKLDRQVKRHKERKTEHRATPGAKAPEA